MALAPHIDEDGATRVVKGVLDDSKSSRGPAKVPNIWRIGAHRPEYLKSQWAKLRIVLEIRSLDREVKEIVAVAVSATNNCDYRLRSQTDGLRSLGMTDEQLVELPFVVDFFNGFNASSSGLEVEYEPPVLADKDCS